MIEFLVLYSTTVGNERVSHVPAILPFVRKNRRFLNVWMAAHVYTYIGIIVI